jgi:hypothetical protein
VTETVELVTVPAMAKRIGMPMRTLARWVQLGKVTTDGTVRIHTGDVAALLASREGDIRALHQESQERKRAAAGRREAKKTRGSRPNIGGTEELSEDLEARIRSVVRRAWLEGSLTYRSPHFRAASLPYPQEEAA